MLWKCATFLVCAPIRVLDTSNNYIQKDLKHLTVEFSKLLVMVFADRLEPLLKEWNDEATNLRLISV
jgi:hypothetical protein